MVGVLRRLRRDSTKFSLRYTLSWVSTFQFSFLASDFCTCRTDVSLIRPLSRPASPFRSLPAPICALSRLFWMLLCHPSSIPHTTLVTASVLRVSFYSLSHLSMCGLFYCGSFPLAISTYTCHVSISFVLPETLGPTRGTTPHGRVTKGHHRCNH